MTRDSRATVALPSLLFGALRPPLGVRVVARLDSLDGNSYRGRRRASFGHRAYQVCQPHLASLAATSRRSAQMEADRAEALRKPSRARGKFT
jgi:hypothetical protein